MTRKDSEKDSERPHYYSQFWLDVAAGRRVIGAPRPEEEDSDTVEPITLRRSRLSDDGDEQNEQIVHPVAEPVRTPQDFIEPDKEDGILIPGDQDDADYQDDIIEDADVPDMDLVDADAVEEEDEEFADDVDEEDEDEEDEDGMNWGRGRKKAKPTRAVKPAPKKPGKRDTTRRPY